MASDTTINQQVVMLTDYIPRAMRHARRELMENGRFFGCIPGCPGTWGDGATLEECRDELQSVLEDWLMVGIRFGDPLPVWDQPGRVG